MNKQQFEQNISKIHEIFNAQQNHLNSLSAGINKPGKEQDILSDFLDTLNIEKNSETYYIAAARIADKKVEPLDVYAEKL
jgi:hypothetical protein